LWPRFMKEWRKKQGRSNWQDAAPPRKRWRGSEQFESEIVLSRASTPAWLARGQECPHFLAEGTAAGAAIACVAERVLSAVGTQPCWSSRLVRRYVNWSVLRFIRQRPNQGDHPSDDRPSGKHIEYEDAPRIALVVPNDRR